MVPPPKPATHDDTVVCEVAYGPRVAVMLASVGSGPRWYGFVVCAPAPDGLTTRPAKTMVRAARSAPRGATIERDLMCWVPPQRAWSPSSADGGAQCATN